MCWRSRKCIENDYFTHSIKSPWLFLFELQISRVLRIPFNANRDCVQDVQCERNLNHFNSTMATDYF